MATKRIQLAIDSPCQQRWQDMASTETGRFCDQCQKTVVDFSRLDDQQIAAYFLNPPKKVCGRFAANQLNRSLAVEPNVSDHTRKQQWLNLVTAGLMSWSTVQAQPSQTLDRSTLKSGGIAYTPPAITAGDLETSPTSIDSIKTIVGQVFDAGDKMPIPGASIAVKGTTWGTYTDANGKFKIPISDYQSGMLIIEVRAIGSITQEITVNTSREQPLAVFLYDNVSFFGEVVAIRKLTFFQRLRNRLRSSH